MFFRRKPASSTPEQSLPYRSAPPRSQGLSVVLAGPTGRRVGELVEISASGAQVRFPHERDPRLAEQDTVETILQSLSHGTLQITSRVSGGARAKSGQVLYELEFLDADLALQAADPFYTRLLNRRAAPRVRPPLDRSTRVRMSWEGGQVDGRMSELSITGVGLSVPLTEAYRLADVSEVRVSFRLPGHEQALEGPAQVVNRRTAGAAMILGLAFDMEPLDGMARNRDALRAYVQRRAEEMRRWGASGG